jgi:hypothetical protein
MFTLEIAGKPIAVTDASEAEARELFESDAFKDDLMQIESEGAPLSVRPATRAEIVEFENTPFGDGEDVDPITPMIMFLVDIDEPDEDYGDTGFSQSKH